METRKFVNEVARRIGADERRAEGLIFTVFQTLQARLPAKEAADLQAQLPTGLKRLWRAEDRDGRPVEKLHAEDFIGRVRHWAALPDEAEARERSLRCSVRSNTRSAARRARKARPGTC